MNNPELLCNKDVMLAFLKSVKNFGGNLLPKYFTETGEDMIPYGKSATAHVVSRR